MAGKVYTLLELLISRVATVAFISLTEYSLYSIDNSEEIVALATDLSFCFFLDYFFVDDFEGEVQVIDNIVLHNEVKGHVLS